MTLSLIGTESRLESSVQFRWKTLDDDQVRVWHLCYFIALEWREYYLDAFTDWITRGLFLIQECCLASAWYEVLSVVHMMAMLALFEANLLLIPKNSQVGGERKVSEGLFIFLLLLANFFHICL